MHRHALAVVLALAATVSLSAPVAAQSHRDVITGQLNIAASVMGREGFVAAGAMNGGEPIIGLLPVGGIVFLEIELEADVAYVVTGACDADCTDLDLTLVDEDGETLVEDMEIDDVPMLHFVAPRGARYMLGVGMSDCSTEACFFGFQVLRAGRPVS